MFLFVVVLVAVTGAVTGQDRTKMIIVDAETRQLHKIDYGRSMAGSEVETFTLPGVGDIAGVEYDYVDDRVYLFLETRQIKSMFINGTDVVDVANWTSRKGQSFTMDPIEKLIFGYSATANTVFRMNIDGTDERLLARVSNDVVTMAVDSVNKYVYWGECFYISCNTIKRIAFTGEDMNTYWNLQQPLSAHSIDFDTLDMYSGCFHGLCKVNLETKETESYDNFRTSDLYRTGTSTVYDPKTQRLFTTNSMHQSYVEVFNTEGRRLSVMGGFQLSREGRKFVRINPQIDNTPSQ